MIELLLFVKIEPGELVGVWYVRLSEIRVGIESIYPNVIVAYLIDRLLSNDLALLSFASYFQKHHSVILDRVDYKAGSVCVEQRELL